jgi:DNA adenine methylase
MKITPPLKWHGGKGYLASRIVELMPQHLHYVEPFAGGLAVLLHKAPDGISEVVNDADGTLMNFWKVMANEPLFEKFERRCEATPFSQPLFDQAMVNLPSTSGSASPVDDAYWFFIRCRMSLAGRMDSFAPLSRNRVRRQMNEQVSAWLNAVEGLSEVHARLKRIVILNADAKQVISQQDSQNTLVYADPPYVPQARTARDVYAHEMSLDDHGDLLDLFTSQEIKGKVMLSGYDNHLYSDRLRSWDRIEFDMPNHSASGVTKRRMTEVIWANFELKRDNQVTAA